MYDAQLLKSTKFSTPTIVVGNLSVGGTGKTPQIEYLIRLLQNNYKVAVLSRGYKRKTKGFLIAKEGETSESIGDEPFQYYQKFPSIIVSVDGNRTRGIQQLEQLDNPPDIILLDDAFQHRKVIGGLNILLTTYNDLYIDDCMLPTGNLREHKSGAKRASIIIVTKCPSELSKKKQGVIANKLELKSNQILFFTSISYDMELKGTSKIDLLKLKNEELLLVTGIANPIPLTTFLKSKGIQFKHLKFPDHYHFKKQDISAINKEAKLLINKKIVLTTEKDYVRIFAKLPNLWYMPIETKFVDHKEDFDNLIKKYVE